MDNAENWQEGEILDEDVKGVIPQILAAHFTELLKSEIEDFAEEKNLRDYVFIETIIASFLVDRKKTSRIRKTTFETRGNIVLKVFYEMGIVKKIATPYHTYVWRFVKDIIELLEFCKRYQIHKKKGDTDEAELPPRPTLGVLSPCDSATPSAPRRR
jgi:hypothetical protein